MITILFRTWHRITPRPFDLHHTDSCINTPKPRTESDLTLLTSFQLQFWSSLLLLDKVWTRSDRSLVHGPSTDGIPIRLSDGIHRGNRLPVVGRSRHRRILRLRLRDRHMVTHGRRILLRRRRDLPLLGRLHHVRLVSCQEGWFAWVRPRVVSDPIVECTV
jgi:hypothetical protein